MASLIRYFGYLTLLAYGRAPTQPLWLVHARLSEYRKERSFQSGSMLQPIHS